MSNLLQSPAWRALQAHHDANPDLDMRTLFAAEPARFKNMSVRGNGLLLDYSKHRVTGETLQLLFDLARAQDVEGWRAKMFSGVAINTTENRAVLHTALRRPETDQIMIDGQDVMPGIHATLQKMAAFSASVRNDNWLGYSGQPIKTIINIGIGGSDLGPHMVCEALRHLRPALDLHFVSNVDGAHLVLALQGLDPATTLFVIASKTFTTQETMANAASARNWLLAHFKDDQAVARHFVALSTNEKAVTEFGIAADNMFPFRDWVGGRYSLWSAIGLSISLAYGFETFRALLDGAHAMDRHFQDTPLEQNMPVILALLGLWYRNFCGLQSYAVLPYAQNLRLLPAFLQQVDMESNGKSVDRDGRSVQYQTGPIVFGEPGTNGQHAFYQLIHQGTTVVPCDFIGVVEPPIAVGKHHELLLANLVAQSQALLQGRPAAAVGGNAQKAFSGNRPSTTILLDSLSAYNLGQLIALYEHKIFVQGILWNINSFDQWGVELGKVLASDILKIMHGAAADGLDSSTRGLLAYLGGRA